MAQTEDTELRDLVIEALEKNGSLAKIRALLRANIFLAFEDERDNVKQNASLENILKLPEGILSLTIVHEFLEFCNLKNSLFVYMAESRQGREYNCENKRTLIEKLNLENDSSKEPILITLIKLCSQKKQMRHNIKGKTDTDNCTYIVEDLHSSATSNSHSDTSSDEKNKLHLRLHLDNSDTDTSNDSSRDKVRSEYYPNEHTKSFKTESKSILQQPSEISNGKGKINVQKYVPEVDKSMAYQNIKDANNSTESTSYVALKSLNAIDEKLFNTAGVPINENTKAPHSVSNDLHEQNDFIKSATLSSNSVVSLKDDINSKSNGKETHREKDKSDGDTAEYSFDFSASLSRKSVDALKNIESTQIVKSNDYHQNHKNNSNKDSFNDGQHQSSVSISDVADLLSEKSSSIGNQINNDKSTDSTRLSIQHNSRRKSDSYKSKVLSDDSGDFTESPIASLSNLSLDIHSD